MRIRSIDNIFKGSGAYVAAPNNIVGAILVDEAHRLNKKSGLYGQYALIALP